jgi:hypothetical protein
VVPPATPPPVVVRLTGVGVRRKGRWMRLRVEVDRGRFWARATR